MNFIKYISVIVLIFIIRVGYSQSINIYFKTDSFEVTQSSATQLVEFLSRNKDSNNKYRFEIIGRTDNEGNPEYNKNLSLKRANSTKSFLVSKGIDTTNLILTGYGEYKPIANNNNEEGKAQNRCVTVNITKWSERLSQLLNDSLKIEEFDFHTKNGYTKKLNDCCSITFKPFALADSLGKEINGNIKLRVTYYKNAIDMIKSNITMQAKVGGMDIAYKSHLMFTIEAFYNKKPLKTVYENYVSLDCGCTEMLKNSSVFSFNDGKWEVIEKPKKDAKPIVETKTGDGSKKGDNKDQIEEDKKIDKPIITPPVVINPPGGGGKQPEPCKSPWPCLCVDYLAGGTSGATFAKDEWHVNVGDKRIRWGFPNIYPNHIDSIIDFNARYSDFNFCRKGYVSNNMIETIDFSIKISLQEKGFFKKKKYLKIKSTDLKNFPELVPIKKQIWKIQKETFPYSDKEFKKMKFHDFRVINEGKDFTIELKAKDEFIKIKVNVDEKEIKEPYNKYQSELEKLSKRVSDSLSKRLKNLDENYLNLWCEIKHCYNIIFPELEKDMQLQEWRKYIYENKDKFYSTLMGLYNQKALATLKFCPIDTIGIIDGPVPKRPGNGIGLGTLNVDEVIEIKDTLQKVKYFLENGQEAYVKQVYVFNKTNRTIVNVENPNQFKCNFNDKSNIILLLDYRDKQFLLNENKPIVLKNNITNIKLIESPGSLEQFKKIVESTK